MEAKIRWISGCYEGIKDIYRKAEEDPEIGELLSKLEDLALEETIESCGFVEMEGAPLTGDMVLRMTEQEREEVMVRLSKKGILEYRVSEEEPLVYVKFSSDIPKVMGCTMFALLDRLMNLYREDQTGSYVNGTLNLNFPLSGWGATRNWVVLLVRLFAGLEVEENVWMGRWG